MPQYSICCSAAKPGAITYHAPSDGVRMVSCFKPLPPPPEVIADLAHHARYFGGRTRRGHRPASAKPRLAPSARCRRGNHFRHHPGTLRRRTRPVSRQTSRRTSCPALARANAVVLRRAIRRLYPATAARRIDRTGRLHWATVEIAGPDPTVSPGRHRRSTRREILNWCRLAGPREGTASGDPRPNAGGRPRHHRA